MEDSSNDSDIDSLFDEIDDISTATPAAVSLSLSKANTPSTLTTAASRHASSIAGLFFDPSLRIPIDLEKALWDECYQRYFFDGNTNQIMLFERASSFLSHDLDTRINVPATSSSPSPSKLPPFLTTLLITLSSLLLPHLPQNIHALLFPTFANGNKPHCARQVILNHYNPGEGITPHVDLLGRYGDGIIGVSLGSGTVMDFAPAASTASNIRTALGEKEEGNEGPWSEGCRNGQHLYLPAGSVIVMTGEARYEWTHGIAKRKVDLVENDDGDKERIGRGERISITFRWLLPGADVVGG